MKNFFSDIERLRKMKDEEIDFSDCPEMDDEFLKTVKIVSPADKAMILIDRDTLEWFKRQGEGYQEKINLLLRKHMETQQLKKS